MIDNYILAICKESIGKDLEQIQDQSTQRDSNNQDALILARALN